MNKAKPDQLKDSIYSEDKYSEYFSPVENKAKYTESEMHHSEKKGKNQPVLPVRAIIAVTAVIIALAIFFISNSGNAFKPDEESSLVIVENQLADTTPEPKSTAAPAAKSDTSVTKFKVDQKWVGTISVTDYKGEESSVSNGVIGVNAYIGETADGRTYFEIYYNDKPDADPILSMWVTIKSKELRPVIGYDDAWYFDIYLDDNDGDIFTFKLVNGSIHHEYEYKTGDQSCNIELSLAFAP